MGLFVSCGINYMHSEYLWDYLVVVGLSICTVNIRRIIW